MLDKYNIGQFVKTLTQIGTEKKPSSKYQVSLVECENHEIMVYKSGIVIFDSDSLEVIKKVLKAIGVENPIIEVYDEQVEVKEASGWKSTPKGVWLSEKQLAFFMNLVTQDPSVQIISAQKNERVRYQRGSEILVINHNNVVYTIGGFDNLGLWLEKAVKSTQGEQSSTLIAIIYHMGKWNRIGPVVFCIALVTLQKLAELQLQGIKHASLSRSTDTNYFNQAVEDNVTVKTIVFEPGDINSACDDRMDYEEFFKQNTSAFIGKHWQQLLQTVGFDSEDMDEHQILIETSEELHALVYNAIGEESRDHITIYSRSPQDISMPISLGSMICHDIIEKWRQSMENRYGIKLNRSNYQLLNHHPKKQYFLKLFL